MEIKNDDEVEIVLEKGLILYLWIFIRLCILELTEIKRLIIL